MRNKEQLTIHHGGLSNKIKDVKLRGNYWVSV